VVLVPMPLRLIGVPEQVNLGNVLIELLRLLDVPPGVRWNATVVEPPWMVMLETLLPPDVTWNVSEPFVLVRVTIALPVDAG